MCARCWTRGGWRSIRPRPRCLYEPDAIRRGVELLGPRLVLWGSDFPLRDQAADRAAVEAALPDEALRRAVMGENAARFLGLGDAAAGRSSG